ncbi:MAG TPA: hypothetical protein VM867_08490 [Xanthobacteraceae bacterium]|nr:hypothetical protein [Xanthobacteraceae bacterium]
MHKKAPLAIALLVLAGAFSAGYMNPGSPATETTAARVNDVVSIREGALGCSQELATGLAYYVGSNKYSGKSDISLVREWTAIKRSKCNIFPASEPGVIKEVLPESKWASEVYCIAPADWGNCVWFDRSDFNVRTKKS